MLDLNSIDLEEIATALADQNDYEHHWLISPETGKTAFWTADTGIDGHTPVDLDELDLVVIDPLPLLPDSPVGTAIVGASRLGAMPRLCWRAATAARSP